MPNSDSREVKYEAKQGLAVFPHTQWKYILFSQMCTVYAYLQAKLAGENTGLSPVPENIQTQVNALRREKAVVLALL